MSPETSTDMVRRAYEAFATGDLERLEAMFADDAVWRVSGHGGLAGTKRGRAAIVAYFGELVRRSAGTLTLTLHEVVGADDLAVGLHENQATRGTDVLHQRVVLVARFRAGLFVDVSEFHEDQAQYDAFWSEDVPAGVPEL